MEPSSSPSSALSSIEPQRSGPLDYLRLCVHLGLLIYVVEYCCYSNFGNSPIPDLVAVWAQVWDPALNWLGHELLHLENVVISVAATGSGDRLGNYLQVGVMAFVAALVASVWAGFSNARKHERRAHELVWICTRYTLALAMLQYGFAKIYHVQMLASGPDRLMEPYGESSPMGLLWTFLGYSAPYGFLIGAAEALAGLFLYFRRTATLGALLTFGIMFNVTLLNFCFDVPVKLYSAHLTLLALFVAAPDLPRLASVLWFHRTHDAAKTDPHRFEGFVPSASTSKPSGFGQTRSRMLVSLKLFVIALSIVGTQGSSLNIWMMRQSRSEFYGFYRVERFSRDGLEVLLLASDAKLWRVVGVDDDIGASFFITIRTMDDTAHRFRVEAKAGEKALSLTRRDTAKPVLLNFQYRWNGPDQLILEGPWDGQKITVHLHRMDTSHHLLTSREFRWISEAPFDPARP